MFPLFEVSGSPGMMGDGMESTSKSSVANSVAWYGGEGHEHQEGQQWKWLEQGEGLGVDCRHTGGG